MVCWNQMTVFAYEYYNNLLRKYINNGYFVIVWQSNNNIRNILGILPYIKRTTSKNDRNKHMSIYNLHPFKGGVIGSYSMAITPLLWCHKTILRLIQLATANRNPAFPYSKC